VKERQEGEVTTAFAFDDSLHDLADATLIQQPIDETHAE
jgi:hypothetical protein